MKFRYKLTFSLGLVVLLLDQATKILIEQFLPLGGKTVIPGVFNLVYVLNKGAAFGFLNRADIHWQTYFFIGVSALAVVLIIQLLRTVDRHDPVLFTGLGLILGGALGNLIDRIRIGKVIDFLDIHLGAHHWPAFNVADIAITLGAVALLITFFKRRGNVSNTR
ncbi:MAG: signal peptidase II [Desulfovibrionales bacterium]